MKKAPLYSRSRSAGRTPSVHLDEASSPELAELTEPSTSPLPEPPMHVCALQRERRLWIAIVALLLMMIGAWGWSTLHDATKAPLTMEQIDSALRKSIIEKPLPSPQAKAYETILPSVVRVVGLMTDGDDGDDNPRPAKGSGRDHAPLERGVGTGVVIIDNGTILTSLHVIQGAKRVKVLFMDGTESDALVVSKQPENDLAVLRAKTIPDDLQAATLRSTADLAPGDHVLAVGFPFGIGPSASAGVVSGLNREFHSPSGREVLTNLIQFDAAANPGNSGGPLVTMEGEVVGIVAAILNPSQQHVFIGIGFAVPIESAASAVGMPPF